MVTQTRRVLPGLVSGRFFITGNRREKLMPWRVLVLLLAMIGSASLAAAAPATITLWEKFPDQQGQNGFSAQACHAQTGAYRLLERLNAYYFGTPEQGYTIPYLARAASPWINLHPSMIPSIGTYHGPEHAVLTWQPPEINRYQLTVQFVAWGGGDVTVYVRKNADTLFTQDLTAGAPSADFSAAGLALGPDDRLHFGVAAGINDNNDTTRLKGEITYTPLTPMVPPTMLLLD
jgi:hypothetical protein